MGPPPSVTYDVAAEQWRLTDAYFFESEHVSFVIPPGFLFDLASVPRITWSLIAPFDLSIAAPLVHDYLYRTGGRPVWVKAGMLEMVDRREADQIFRLMMIERGVPGWRRYPAHLAVRWFGGWKAWGGGVRSFPNLQEIDESD